VRREFERMQYQFKVSATKFAFCIGHDRDAAGGGRCVKTSFGYGIDRDAAGEPEQLLEVCAVCK
jgi:hypothetical protein